jgi:hypothetical protein
MFEFVHLATLCLFAGLIFSAPAKPGIKYELSAEVMVDVGPEMTDSLGLTVRMRRSVISSIGKRPL